MGKVSARAIKVLIKTFRYKEGEHRTIAFLNASEYRLRQFLVTSVWLKVGTMTKAANATITNDSATSGRALLNFTAVKIFIAGNI